MIYEVLPELLAGGYVEYRKDGKVAYYKPVHPGKLLDLVNQKKRDVALLEDEMRTTIQSLAGKFNLAFNRPGVKFFEGVEGLKEIYRDTLREQKPIYAILSPAAIEPSLKEWLDNVYVKERVAKKIEAQVIASSSSETECYHRHDTESLRETIVVPQSKFPIDMEIDLYGTNQIAFISLAKGIIGVIGKPGHVYHHENFFSARLDRSQTFFAVTRAARTILIGNVGNFFERKVHVHVAVVIFEFFLFYFFHHKPVRLGERQNVGVAIHIPCHKIFPIRRIVHQSVP